MSSHISQLESLPSEILFELFQYLNAQDLFQAFHNLNNRFNGIIRSSNDIKPVFYLKRSNNNHINKDSVFPAFVYTLIIDSDVDLNLRLFPNIHRLKFEWFSSNELVQLCTNVLPHLEELTLVYIETLSTNMLSLSLPSLCILKARFINLSIYKIILSACPNLNYFQLSMFTSEKCSLNIEKHNNLKQLIIKVSDVIWPWNDDLFNYYLSCVPNLEQFCIHRLIYISRSTEFFINYDWLRPIISIHLQTLRLFKFYLRTCPSKNITNLNMERTINQLQEYFQSVHNSQYRSQLIIQCL